MRNRAGSTLIEQLVVLAVIGVCIGLVFTGGATLVNTAAVHGASREVAELFAMARDRAMATGVRTAVHLDDTHQRMVVHAYHDTLARLELRPRAIAIESTRDSMAFLPSGLGYGAANLRVIVRKGASRDTITVSRLGRVKR
jgi:Tfp pilus assembly protein FimT